MIKKTESKRAVGLRFAVAFFTIAGLSSARLVAASELPDPSMKSGVVYVTGGIGDGEAAALKKAEADYPLALEFVQRAEQRNEYLADVAVTIKDRRGKTVLDVMSEGPFLLAKLPNGRYTLTAEVNGKAQSKQVSIVANAHRRVVFVW